MRRAEWLLREAREAAEEEAGAAALAIKQREALAQVAQRAVAEEELEVKAAGEAAAAAYAACPNFDVLVEALLAGGIELMKARCTGRVASLYPCVPGLWLEPV